MFDATIRELKRLYFLHGEEWFQCSQFKPEYTMSLHAMDVADLIHYLDSFNPKMKISKKAIDYFTKIV